MASEKTYIVAVYYSGGWEFLQRKGKISWVFSTGIKTFKTLHGAENTANKLNRNYQVDKVSVFDITGVERFSSSDVYDWADRLMYEIDNRKIDKVCR